jgi:hypothetical protein
VSATSGHRAVVSVLFLAAFLVGCEGGKRFEGIVSVPAQPTASSASAIGRNGPRKLLGHHALLAWRGKEAILGVYRVATLGARKCDLTKSVKTP